MRLIINSRIRLFVLMVVLVLLASFPAFCRETVAADAPTTDPEVRALQILQKLENRYQETKTFQGEFDQRKVSVLFQENIESEGRFWYEKPGKFRCEYLPPNAQTNLIVDDLAYVYIPEIKQVEIYHFDPGESPVGKLNQMLLGFGVKVSDVKDVYDVRWLPEQETDSVTALHFIPKKKESELPFESIKMWLNKKTLLPARLEFLEASGDSAMIEMKKIEYNEKIKASRFKPDFPRDAEVIEQY